MSLTGSERFPKTARLRKRAQFLKLSRGGGKFQSTNFVVISKANEGMESRLGITVSAKVGNAVVRNRIKRQVREYFRRHRVELPMARDFVVVARASAAGMSSDQIARELEDALTRSRLRS